MSIKTCLMAAGLATAIGVAAQSPKELKVGVVTTLSGVYGVGGKQMQAGIKAYLKQHGEEVAGRKITLIYRDTGGPNPDAAKRAAQELIARDNVDVLAGFDFTPGALAVAPLSSQAKVPMIVMNAATSVITAKSPYIVRTSFTSAQTSFPMGQWAHKQGLKSVYVTVADFAPGHEAALWFKKGFEQAGGKIVGELALPITSFDYAPFLQRVKDAKPDAVFSFLPVGEPMILYYKAWADRGLGAAGIKLLSPEGSVDNDVLQAAGTAAVGAISTGFYTPSHDSKQNKEFISAYRSVSDGKMDPNYLAVGAYDGMAVLYEALKKTKGVSDGPALVAAMKGLSLDSPRGPLSIDPETRDPVNTVYVRRVEMVNGKPMAVEFDKFDAVKDVGKSMQ